MDKKKIVNLVKGLELIKNYDISKDHLDSKRLDSIIKSVNENSKYLKENKDKFSPEQRKTFSKVATQAENKLMHLENYRKKNTDEKDAIDGILSLQYSFKKSRRTKKSKSVKPRKRRSVKSKKSRKARSVKPRKSVKRRSVKPRKSRKRRSVVKPKKSRKARSVKPRKSRKRKSVKPRKSRKRKSVKPRKSRKRRYVFDGYDTPQMRVGHHYDIMKRGGEDNDREHFLGRLVGRHGDSDIYRFDYIRIFTPNTGWQQHGLQRQHRDFSIREYEFTPFSFEHENYW